MVAALCVAATDALAACPIELAVYRDRDGVAGIDFRPAGDGATVTNAFRMHVGDRGDLDGFVMWTSDVARPYAMLTHGCPEGDATGDEIAACTLWEGVVYAVDASGGVALLPRQGEPAPQRLVLPDLARIMQASPAYAAAGLSGVPFDVFELSGCQE
ncbi:MAG: hypothetical protein JNL61_04845 [Rhizobiaceae bacterium]|nr:hypothetical protein [Rhizobiaceae bacterium]